MIGKYFFKKRPLANGLAMAGSPVFLSTLAPVNQIFFGIFGWRGSFLILGGLLLNCCVAGSLMRPIGPKPDQVKKEVTKEALQEAGKAGLKKEEGSGDASADLIAGKAKKEKLTVFQTINKFLDLSLFTHRGFLIYLSGNVIMFFGLFTPLVFLSNYAKSKHIANESAAFLLSILAFVDMVARPSMGLVANTKWIRPRVQYFFAISVIYNGVCHLLAPLSTSYAGFCVYAGFFGFAFGWLSSVLFETLMDLVGTQRFSSAVGLVTIVECCPVLLGPPLLGRVWARLLGKVGGGCPVECRREERGSASARRLTLVKPRRASPSSSPEQGGGCLARSLSPPWGGSLFARGADEALPAAHLGVLPPFPCCRADLF